MLVSISAVSSLMGTDSPPTFLLLFLLGGLLLGLLASRPTHAQTPVDVEAAREYARSLDHNFWERAWVQHLQERANENGSIEWFYSDRQQLSDLTSDYQQAISDANGFWATLQVQDYLQRQLLTVQPNRMMLGRPGAFRLRVLSTSTPNALALNDGTIILTTGLLTALETSAQLRALLAHEVAHVVLDHALTTYRTGKRRSRARNLLGNVVSGVTSVVAPGFGRGSFESTVYGLSSDLATKYLNREFIAAAGLDYTRSQEEAANRLAQEWLLTHDDPVGALDSALRILHRAGTHTHVTHGSSFLNSHPASDDRREQLAAILEEHDRDPSALTADVPPDSTYDTAMAAVLQHEGEVNLAARRFHSAINVLDRAIATPWVTPQAYLFKAIAVRNTTTGSDGIDEAWTLLKRAADVADRPEPRIEAERALLRIRQGDAHRAEQHLERCLAQIESNRMAPGHVEGDETYESLETWAREMRIRLRE